MATAPDRLDHDAQRTMRAFLTTARLLAEQLEQELRRESGMSLIDYEVLAWLSETPGRQMRMAELARRTGVSASRLTHLTERLEQRDWVHRLTSPTDRRIHFAQLTRVGQHALEEAAPWHADCAQSRLLAHLTHEQLDQLRDISERLRCSLTGQRTTSRALPPTPAGLADAPPASAASATGST
jgi:DNA-binding MarR family transcriptional regulator